VKQSNGEPGAGVELPGPRGGPGTSTMLGDHGHSCFINQAEEKDGDLLGESFTPHCPVRMVTLNFYLSCVYI